MIGAPTDLTFDLVDQDGNPMTASDLAGTNVVMFFGFTNCDMVCPMALDRLGTVMTDLGPAAAQFQPVYVTVDPDRDSPEVMRRYLEQRETPFIGLTGDAEELGRLRDAMHVFTTRVEDPNAPDGYRMPHTAVTYVFDREGRYLTHLGDGLSAEAMAGRLRAIADSERAIPTA